MRHKLHILEDTLKIHILESLQAIFPGCLPYALDSITPAELKSQMEGIPGDNILSKGLYAVEGWMGQNTDKYTRSRASELRGIICGFYRTVLNGLNKFPLYPYTPELCRTLLEKWYWQRPSPHRLLGLAVVTDAINRMYRNDILQVLVDPPSYMSVYRDCITVKELP